MVRDKKTNYRKHGSRRSNNRKPAAEENFDSKVMDSKSGRIKDEDRDNDPTWYYTDTRLAEQTSNLSFHSFLGEGTTIAGVTYETPSIMVLHMNPSPGNTYYYSNGLATPAYRNGLNLASTKLYTLLSTYSGRAANTYAPQDVGTLILAMGEIVSCVEDLRRVFGVSYTFSERNRSLPKLLVESMGINYKDFISKRSIYIDQLNALITRFNQLPILGNIAYILKCRDMYQKIYTDSNASSEAQIVYMSPHTTWTLNETTYSGGTILVTTGWNSNSSTTVNMSARLTTLDNMVEALFGSSTLNVIYADLLNLASKINVPMFKLDYVTNDYVVVPEYNLNFLLQVHNADVIGNPNAVTTLTESPAGYKVTPYNNVFPDADNNALVYNPAFTTLVSSGATGFGDYMYSVVDMMSDQYTTADIIEATRYKLMSTWSWEPSNSTRHTFIQSIPDHYAVEWSVYSTSLSNRTSIATNRLLQQSTSFLTLSKMSQFDWAPLVYSIASNSNMTITGVCGDLNFYTSLPETTLAAMNRIIYQCLFEFRTK